MVDMPETTPGMSARLVSEHNTAPERVVGTTFAEMFRMQTPSIPSVPAAHHRHSAPKNTQQTIKETLMTTVVKRYEVRLKALTEGAPGTFEAYVSTYGNIDLVGDRVMPGAFDKSIADLRRVGDPIPIVYSHNWEDPWSHIGFVDPKDLISDKTGLKVARGHLDIKDNPLAAQVYRLMKRRQIKEFSFSYEIRDEGLDPGDGANNLKELGILEIGPCFKGANPETQLLGIKKMSDEMRRNYAQKYLDASAMIPGTAEELMVEIGEAVNEWVKIAYPATTEPTDKETDTSEVMGEEPYACVVGTYLDTNKIVVKVEGEGIDGETYVQLTYNRIGENIQLSDPTPADVNVTVTPAKSVAKKDVSTVEVVDEPVATVEVVDEPVATVEVVDEPVATVEVVDAHKATTDYPDTEVDWMDHMTSSHERNVKERTVGQMEDAHTRLHDSGEDTSHIHSESRYNTETEKINHQIDLMRQEIQDRHVVKKTIHVNAEGKQTYDDGPWDVKAVMQLAAKGGDPVGTFDDICAGRSVVGSPVDKNYWLLAHHSEIGGPPVIDGVKQALELLPHVKNLMNGDSAQVHLENHMKQIEAAKVMEAGGEKKYILKQIAELEDGDRVTEMYRKYLKEEPPAEPSELKEVKIPAVVRPHPGNIEAENKIVDLQREVMRSRDEKAIHHDEDGKATYDDGEWNGDAAMEMASNADDPAAAYKAICAGTRLNVDAEPDEADHWALPHHNEPDGPPVVQGVGAAIGSLNGSRDNRVEDLSNEAEARTHLEGHQANIEAARQDEAGGEKNYIAKRVADLEDGDRVTAMWKKYLGGRPPQDEEVAKMEAHQKRLRGKPDEQQANGDDPASEDLLRYQAIIMELGQV